MRKKFGLSCNLTVREPAYAVLVASADCPTTLELASSERVVKKLWLVHNAQVQAVDIDAISADEMWSFVEKNKNVVCLKNSKSEIVGSP